MMTSSRSFTRNESGPVSGRSKHAKIWLFALFAPVLAAPTCFASKPSPTAHTVYSREVLLSAGAGFIVAIAGNMMTMPGLPKSPAAERIDVTDEGKIVGLF